MRGVFRRCAPSPGGFAPLPRARFLCSPYPPPMSEHSTFTFVFTDIEGSSRPLGGEPGDDGAPRWRGTIRCCTTFFSTHGGDVCSRRWATRLLVAFEDSGAALFAAIQAQRALLAEEWETAQALCACRAALHRGPAETAEQRLLFGPTLKSHLRALLSAGHGGQTLLSRAARGGHRAAGRDSRCTTSASGACAILARPEADLPTLARRGCSASFPPLRSARGACRTICRRSSRPSSGREARAGAGEGAGCSASRLVDAHRPRRARARRGLALEVGGRDAGELR